MLSIIIFRIKKQFSLMHHTQAQRLSLYFGLLSIPVLLMGLGSYYTFDY